MLRQSGLKQRTCLFRIPFQLRSQHGYASQRYTSSTVSKEHEEVHDVSPNIEKLDRYLEEISRGLAQQRLTTIHDLYQQYLNEAGNVINRVVPYEERPHAAKRADASHDDCAYSNELEGDGLVLVVHAQLDASLSHLEKTTVCSGFVVNASTNHSNQGDTIVTCAHTLEEVRALLYAFQLHSTDHYLQISRHLKRNTNITNDPHYTFSFIIPANGQPRPVTRLLSSMPRSDVIVLESQPSTTSPSTSKRLRSLPLTPFPVYPGTRILTHLFGSPDPPEIKRSIARTRTKPPDIDVSAIERPIPWLSGNAWRRWGSGLMLGYRSYTGLEVEVCQVSRYACCKY